MGGYGSGLRDFRNTKAVVTHFLRLDVQGLVSQGVLGPDVNSGTVFECSWIGGPGEPKSSIGIQVGRGQLTLHYRYSTNEHNGQDIRDMVPISWTPCHYGGRRPWFLCPGFSNGRPCDRRVAKIFLRNGRFLCRRCHGLAYPSQTVTVKDRPLTRAQNIRMRLGGSANMTEPFPWKPKGMHWRTYWRWSDKGHDAQMKYLRIAQSKFAKLTGRAPTG